MVWMERVWKPRGLFHVHSFFEVVMKKYIFNVELMERPTMSGGKREDKANGSGFNDRTKGFMEVMIF